MEEETAVIKINSGEKPLTWWQKLKTKGCCGADRKCCGRGKIDEKRFDNALEHKKKEQAEALNAKIEKKTPGSYIEYTDENGKVTEVPA